MNISFNESQLKLTAITEHEALSSTSIITKSFSEKEEHQYFLKSIFNNHSNPEHDQFAIYLKLMHEYIGLDPPVDISDYLITNQHSGAYFRCFLTSFTTAIAEKTRGDHLCQVM